LTVNRLGEAVKFRLQKMEYSYLPAEEIPNGVSLGRRARQEIGFENVAAESTNLWQ
jgi:hypothetical protein